MATKKTDNHQGIIEKGVENVGRVRDIIFGAQKMREYEERLARMDEQLSKEVERLRDETDTCLDKFEHFVKAELVKLADTLAAEKKERLEEEKGIGSDMSAMEGRLATAVDTVDAQLAHDTREIREQLRELIVGGERGLLESLRQRLDDPGLRAEELVETIRISQDKGKDLAAAIEQPVQACIKQSVERDTQFFADALFPVMGPAIRRSINESLKTVIQGINAAIESRFSMQRLKWEWEARQSGLSYAEVVLKHTLVYRVEQVLLVQRSTGLLVQHAERSDIESRDGDAVSAMLTAIQDFVRDSFAPEGEQEGDLGSVSVGDQTVWLLNSPELTMACVIRGIAPESLRIKLQEILEDLLLRQRSLIGRFDGDREPMAPLLEDLERCFGYVKTVDAKSADPSAEGTGESQKETQRASRIAKVVKTPFFYIALLVIAICLWVFIVHSLERSKKADLLALYNNTPGIVVTDTHWTDVEEQGFWRYIRPERKLVVEGMQDPDLNNANRLAREVVGYRDERIETRMRPYLSLLPDAQLQRALAYFTPPATVQLRLENNTVIAEGSARQDWLQHWQQAVVTLPGVSGIDLSAVAIDFADERAALQQLRTQIEQQVLYFKDAQSTSTSFAETLASVQEQLRQYQTQAQAIGQDFKLIITAYSDQLGGEALNQFLRLTRAGQVKQALLAGGIAENLVVLKDGGALGEQGQVSLDARKVVISLQVDEP